MDHSRAQTRTPRSSLLFLESSSEKRLWNTASALKGKFFFFSFWLFWVFVAAHGLSLVAAGGSFSLVAVHGLITVVASLVAEHGLQEFRLIDLAVPKHVKSFVNRD